MKTIPLQFGRELIEISIPDAADVLSAEKIKPLTDPVGRLSRSLNEPIAAPALHQLARGKETAAIVVSDHTRPVPYKEPDGILAPIIEVLKQHGIGRIKIIVATGTHKPMTETQLRQMLGESAFQDGVEIINHVCTDKSMLRSIGRTERTPDVTVNRHYLDAQLKILTGLVEPHFMPGVSGGRKAICPGICGQSVTFGFHSASILNEKKTASMVLEGNPCHEEALRIAKMAGSDFTINLTIDSNEKIVGIFTGDMEKAHQAAVEHLRSFAIIKLKHP